MRVRHRIPSIFNLSMVDVLCCALGCVILLWLINLREAKNHEDSAAEQNLLITARLDNIRAERDNIIGMMMQMESKIESVQQEKDDLQKSLSAKQTESDDLSRRLKASAGRVADLEGHLRERTKSHEAAMVRIAALEKDLRASEKRGEKETARGRELTEEVAAAKRRLKDLQTTANLVPGLRGDLKEAKEQYAAEKALAAALEKEIARRMRELKEADKSLASLQQTRRALERDLEGRDRELAAARQGMAALRDEKKALEGETARVRAAAENRFAGITLTGRRVLFLVDMSASMELVNENTQAPTKWADV